MGKLTHAFDFGSEVYIKTDREQIPCQITAVRFFVGGTITYTVACNGTYIDVYEVELTDELDTLKKVT
jgi:hypothetical protein